MHEQDFRTGFFEWRWLGCLWSAKDPIHPDYRWVIRRPCIVGELTQWEVGSQISHMFSCIQAGKSPRALGFVAVGHKIKGMSNILDSSSDMISDVVKSKINTLLDSLGGPYEPVARSEEPRVSNVGQEAQLGPITSSVG